MMKGNDALDQHQIVQRILVMRGYNDELSAER
jgi:hypothetical protein